MTCPKDAVIHSYVAGGMSTTGIAELNRHLATCDACLDLVGAIAKGSGPVIAPNMADPTLAKQVALARFDNVEQIGEGGMGAVFAAYDPELERRVAIKVLRADTATSAASKARSVREARAMARLNHPNVVTIHEVVSSDHQVVIVMEYAAGGTLKSWLKDNDPSWKQTIEMFISAGQGLAAAHKSDLVHRDFKPDNVLVSEDGRPLVTDFGLVSAVSQPADANAASALAKLSASPLTFTGHLLGTPAYMAPEQQDGKAVDSRADQFAFCVSLYEALFGQRPFVGRTLTEIRGHIDRGNIAPGDRRSPVPARVAAIVRRGLQADPDKRYRTMDELVNALRRTLLPRRRWLLVGVGALCVAALGVGVSLGGTDQPAVCTGAAAKTQTVWTQAVQQNVLTTWDATGSPRARDMFTRTDQAIRDYKDNWRAVHLSVCEATNVRREQSPALLDVRMACLDRQLDTLTALIRLFGNQPDRALVDHALRAAMSLPSPSTCTETMAVDGALILPQDPSARERAADLEKRLATIRSYDLTRRYKDGLAAATSLAQDASDLDHPPITSQALFLLARFYQRGGDPTHAVTKFREAALSASAAKDDVLVARSWIGAVATMGHQQSNAEDALELSHVAEVALARVGHQPALRAEWLRAVGMTHYQAANYELAEKYMKEELAIHRGDAAQNPLRAASTLANLGLLYEGRGHYRQGEEHLREAIATTEAALGSDDIRLEPQLNDLGMVLARQNRHREAQVIYERSIAISTATYGADHPKVAVTRGNLGLTLMRQEKLAEAEAIFRHNRSVLADKLGAHPAVGHANQNLATTLAQQGKLEAALKYNYESVEVLTKVHGADHPAVADAIYGVAVTLERLKRPRKALRQAKRAVGIYRARLAADHPRQATGQTLLGALALQLGRLSDAKRYFDNALAIQEKRFGDGMPVVEALVAVIEVAHQQRRWSDVTRLSDRVLKLLDNVPEHQAVAAANVCFDLAKLLWTKALHRTKAKALGTRAKHLLAGNQTPAADKLRKRADKWLARRKS